MKKQKKNKTLNLARFLQASWRCCCSYSGFSLSQLVLYLNEIRDGFDDGKIRS